MTGKTHVPDGWRLARLGDVAEVNCSTWDRLDGSSILYLDLTTVIAPGILSAPKELAATEAPSRARRRVKSGDILVSTVRPNLRGFARVLQAPDNLVASTGFAVLTPLAEVDGSFVYHQIMTEQFAGYLEKATTGQAYPAVRPSDVTSYAIPLPPLGEQRAIAAVLDSIDDAMERTEAVIAATELLRDTLLHELLTRGVPGRHTAWRDVPGLGTIPACWDVVRLGDKIEDGPTNGIYKPESAYGSGTCIIRIDDFIPGSLVRAKDFQRILVTEEERRRYLVSKDDILINRVNSLSHIAKSVLIPQLGEPTLFESNMIKLRMCDDVQPKFAANLLLSRNCRQYFISRAKKAVQQASVNQQDISDMPFPLPTLVEQQAIAAVLEGVDEAIERGRTQTDMLRSLKASAAEALLTGRVRVGRCPWK